MDPNSQSLLLFLFRNRKPLLVAPLVAIAASAVFSGPWFITPLYESSVIVFPSTTNSPSKALLPQNTYQSEDFLEFGVEEQAEQLLQVLSSDVIFDTIIDHFNLINHYDLDRKSKTLRSDLHEEFSDRISFERTKFMSVRISVLDQDPQMAADIANYIVDMLDRVKSRIQRERAAVGLKLVDDEYQKVRAELLEMEEEINALRRKGVHEYEGQSMVVSEQYATAIGEERGERAIGQLRAVLDTLAKYGGRYVALRDELSLMKEEEVKIKTKLDQARVDANQVLPATFRVNAAVPADKKKYPIRWLVVAVAALAAFVGTMVVILAANTWKELKEKLPS